MNLVELFVKLIELGSFGHYVLVHEEGRLDLLVTFFTQKVEAIGDEGLIKINAVVCEEIATVSRDFCAYAWVAERQGKGWR